MKKAKIEKEAEEYVGSKSCDTDDYSCGFLPSTVEEMLIEFAEPREKRIAELEAENDDIYDSLNTQSLRMSELEEKLKKETAQRIYNFNKSIEWKEKHRELEAQIEKLIDFVLSKTECCDVCPITDTCINSEGTCPYAGILANGEEAVTREWLMQKIAKEIKEK